MQPVKLNAVVSNWTVPLYQEFLVKTYGAENPNVTLNWQGMAFRPLFESIEIQMGAESPGIDVLGVDVPLVASYGIRNYLLPLDTYFSKEDQEGWLPEAREASTFNGKLIAPPGRTSTQMLYYNKKLFRDAGVDLPSGNARSVRMARCVAERPPDRLHLPAPPERPDRRASGSAPAAARFAMWPHRASTGPPESLVRWRA